MLARAIVLATDESCGLMIRLRNDQIGLIMSARSAPRQTDKAAGYEAAQFNALRHGILSRYTVLPWENADEYKALLDALVGEHSPVGPTEEHLVEEIAGVLWRKRRLRLAENAAFRRELAEVTSSGRQTVEAALIHLKVAKHARADKTEQINSLKEDHQLLQSAVRVLNSGGSQAYEKALRCLRTQMQKRWTELSRTKELKLEPFVMGVSYEADAGGLLQFLEHESYGIAAKRLELESTEVIRDQSFGEAFNPSQLDGLVRYEIHLDRKLERMVSMLFRLKELRVGSAH